MIKRVKKWLKIMSDLWNEIITYFQIEKPIENYSFHLFQTNKSVCNILMSLVLILVLIK